MKQSSTRVPLIQSTTVVTVDTVVTVVVLFIFT